MILIGGVHAYRDHLRATYVPREGQRPYLVFGANIKETDLVPGPTPGEWTLRLRHVAGTDTLTGDRARQALGVLLARVNATGARANTTRVAAERIAGAGGPESYAAALAEVSRRRTGDYHERLAHFRRAGPDDPAYWYNRAKPPFNRGALPYLAAEERLALEMAVNEEAERRALEEEIAPLEAAWREAEEIAAIADDLFTPPEAERFILRHRKRAAP